MIDEHGNVRKPTPEQMRAVAEKIRESSCAVGSAVLRTDDQKPNGWPPFEFGGKKWLRGTAGSLVLECENCGPEETHFREPMNYFGEPPTGHWSWHRCLVCRGQMRPVEVQNHEIR